MKQDTLFLSILVTRLLEILQDTGHASKYSLVSEYQPPPPATKEEIYTAVEWGIEKGYLAESENGVLSAGLRNPETSTTESVKITVSKPRHMELLLGDVREKYEVMEISTAFTTVVSESQRELRICSPFLQSDVLYDDAVPAIENQLRAAFERGVIVKVLTRRPDSGERRKVDWMEEIAEKAGCPESLLIHSYHHTDGRRTISSTHAKMLIADRTTCYLGSGELRRNSIVANFEIGVILRGIIVNTLVAAFEAMIVGSEVWD